MGGVIIKDKHEIENEQFERQWRELLIKRLSTVQAVLKRDATVEEKKLREAQELAAGYKTIEEAQEAYGWAVITENQFESIRTILARDLNTGNVARAALKKINSYIQDLKDDIIQPQSLRDFDAKVKEYNLRNDWEREQIKNNK